MRPAIDRVTCAGHGLCYMVAPDLFTDDENGYGRVISDGELTDDVMPAARRAVGSCPERAIAIIGENARG
ncbi:MULTISPECIES: ferredoxin [unclassified Frankia]|uniref:ferredoxin n=1 Tax=unclassified Frankia TaxID=2632575 RepID=UPI002AD349E8|nr:MULTISPECIES: ferredoxin [unclassified Frankia]